MLRSRFSSFPAAFPTALILVGLCRLGFGGAALADCPEGTPQTYLGGTFDEFVAPHEVAFRRPKLEASFPGLYKDFDDPAVNKAVAHSFLNLPQNIVRAVVTVRMRPEGDLSDNDAVHLGLRPDGSGFVFGRRIKILPGTGDTWTKPPNGAVTFTFDTNTLPEGPELLTRLQEDRFLDFYVQDDTNVDAVELKVWSCPPVIRWGGRPDGFTLPAEKAFPRQALKDAFPQATFKDFDPATSNRFFGHSFLNLPQNIVRAELELRLAPHSDMPTNDILYLGLQAGSSFAFSQSLASLTGTGWTAGTPATTLHLDLGSLSGGLIAKLNADGLLDVLIQDDTKVDYLRLSLWTCPPPIPFSGGPHWPVGDTLVSATAQAIRLGPLDDLDTDGIDIGADGADGACINLACPAEGAGDALTLAAQGTIDNDTPQEFSKLTLQKQGGSVVISADFKFFDQLMTVRVKNGDQLVEEHLAPADGLAAAVPPDTCFKELDWYLFHASTGPRDPNTYCYRLLLQQPTTVDLLQGGPAGVVGTVIEICPPLVVGLPEFRLSRLELRGQGLPELELQTGALRAFSTRAFALGGATLVPVDGGLIVEGVTSEGGQGVAFDLPDASSARLDLDAVDPQRAGPGAALNLEARGVFDGVAGAPLGSLALNRQGEGVEATVDFSNLQTNLQRVQVLRGGDIVAEQVGPAGEGILASHWPEGLGKLGGDTGCYVGHFPTDTIFSLPPVEDPLRTVETGTGDLATGEPVAGDELRILAQGVDGRVGTKSQLRLTAADLPALSLRGLSVATACTPSPTRLCLNDGRFAIDAAWRTRQNRSGAGQAVPLTDDTGYFWFFNESNVEVVIKALVGCPITGRFWIFAGGLTNVAVDLTVTDTATGAVRVYQNVQNRPFQPIQDTQAFDTCHEGLSAPPAAAATSAADFVAGGGEPPGAEAAARLAPSSHEATELLLNGGRFRVRTRWQTLRGTTGVGKAVQLTDDTGYFWFFDESNVEVVTKVLRGCGPNGHYWVFAGGLTNVRVELEVTDTQSDLTRTYINPLETPFQPLQDTRAFETCP